MKDPGLGSAAKNSVAATRSGKFSASGGSSQGETAGIGSQYSAQLNERPNLSNMRNLGPEREGSIVGKSTIPVATMVQRNTGKVA